MARIQPIPDHEARLSVRLTYWFTRRALRNASGRNPARMIEPLQVYAHNPELLSGYAKLEQATAALSALSSRVRALAELRAATVVGCEYCIDMGSQISRRWGLADEEIVALPHYLDSDLFSVPEKLVLEYATAMSRTPVTVTDQLFDALRQHFNDKQLLELTHVIALENLRARFNLAIGITAAGFSEGAVCALPDTDPPTGPH